MKNFLIESHCIFPTQDILKTTDFYEQKMSPLYGKDFYQNIEKRTQKVLRKIEGNNFFKASANLYKTFVHIEDLSKAIIELFTMKFSGLLHVGPPQKDSYFTFYQQRIKSLGYDENLIQSDIINPMEQPYLPLDTSLDTKKATKILKTKFRTAGGIKYHS